MCVSKMTKIFGLSPVNVLLCFACIILFWRRAWTFCSRNTRTRYWIFLSLMNSSLSFHLYHYSCGMWGIDEKFSGCWSGLCWAWALELEWRFFNLAGILMGVHAGWWEDHCHKINYYGVLINGGEEVGLGVAARDADGTLIGSHRLPRVALAELAEALAAREALLTQQRGWERIIVEGDCSNLVSAEEDSPPIGASTKSLANPFLHAFFVVSVEQATLLSTALLRMLLLFRRVT
ncbi:UNVERIFIED_CONTAM: hypothetical protein Sindi_0857800 [Sesamum indicum]